MSSAPDAKANVYYLARAVACVKPAGAGGAAGSIVLPEPETPVVTLLDNGLCVVYLVDEGEHLAYVQKRRLEGIVGGVEALHEVAVANLS